MIIRLFSLLIALFSSAAMADEISLAPLPKSVVDYVATRADGTSSDKKREVTHTIVHKGDWTAVRTQFKAGHISEERVTYFNASGRLFVSVTIGNDPLLYISVTRNPTERELSGEVHFGQKSEETDTALGETCTIWRFKLDRYAGSSCITSDGIELWRRTAGLSDMQLTQLERRPVAPHEVQPPSHLLADSYKFPAASPSEGTVTLPDHEVVLRGKPKKRNTTAETVTLRQRCPWSYEQFEQEGVRRSITTHNPKVGIRAIYVIRETDGFEQLSIRHDRGTQACGRSIEPRSMSRMSPETIQGELCHWHDLTPGMMDASKIACLTADNIMLRTKAGSRGGFDNVYDREAISLRRGPLTLNDVLLPSNLLSAEYWGLPVQ